MKRRILLVDDDLAVLLTLKAVLELHGFEIETASSSAEAFRRMESGVFHMVISDLRMESEESGLQVLRRARSQAYNPATALLTAHPPLGADWYTDRSEARPAGESQHDNGESWNGGTADSLLIKPLGTKDLLRQVEALLVNHADKQHRQNAATKAQEDKRHTG
ncbi:MAG TPA: response regulator [Terriglobales bacterium]|jgi:DNA-binding response OmpR family regulator|nr:response regulator [Terriglobales bacterium]